MNTALNNEHTIAEIRGNVRDARIADVLAATERLQTIAQAESLARIVQADATVAQSLAALEGASEAVREALTTVKDAAAESRDVILQAAQTALALLESATKTAHDRLTAEARAVHDAECSHAQGLRSPPLRYSGD